MGELLQEKGGGYGDWAQKKTTSVRVADVEPRVPYV